MNIKHEDIEVWIGGEPFHIDITVSVESWPIRGRRFGPPEDCYPDEGGDLSWVPCLNSEAHPYLSTLFIPDLAAQIENAAAMWVKDNERTIWESAYDATSEL